MDSKVQQCITQSLNFVMHTHTTLKELSSFLLRQCLNLFQSHRGYLATRDPLYDTQMQYTAVRNLDVSKTFRYQPGETISIPSDVPKNRWLTFSLTYQDKLCGIVGIENGTDIDNYSIQKQTQLFIPVCISTIVGGHLLSLQVQHSHDLFLSSISHEIRTPLNGIVVGIHLMRQQQANGSGGGGSGGDDNDDNDDTLQIVTECSHQLMDIINDILDFTKISCGRLKLYEEPFDLQSLLQEVYDVMSLRANEKHLNLWFHILDPTQNLTTTKIIADRRRIRQILLNLVSNAIKFTSQGFIEIRARCIYHPSSFRSSGSSGSSGSSLILGRLEIEVEDTGIGIPSQDWETIFESFKTVSESTLDPYIQRNGTGLGLAICKTLCEMMNGSIRVKHSEKDKGTCMMVSLGVRFDTTSSLSSSSLPHLTGKTILIGSSQSQQRLELAQKFQTLGIHPILCSTPDEMKWYMKSSHPSWILVENHSYLGEDLDNNNNNNVPTFVIPTNWSSYPWSTWLSSNNPEQQSDQPQQPNQHQHKCRILIVEDNENNKKIVWRMLRILHYDMDFVDHVKNGLEALEKSQQTQYDVIFMDLKMPIMSGFTAAEKIIQYYKTKYLSSSYCRAGIPFKSLLHIQPVIVAMTACVMDMDKEKCKKIGIRGFLGKPLIMDELRTMLQVIQQKQNQCREKYGHLVSNK